MTAHILGNDYKQDRWYHRHKVSKTGDPIMNLK